MPALITYLLKLSVSLAVVFLFYYFILRKLTFYNHNRWYLLGYTVLSFIIPLINIAPVLEKNNWQQTGVITWIPVLGTTEGTTLAEASNGAQLNGWTIVLMLIGAGVVVMLFRFLYQLYRLKKLLRRAVPLSKDGVALYELHEDITPFTFGNSIFLNSSKHTEEELAAIIRHEMVHVKQRHSADIFWGEILCLLNWYNPFAWLIRSAIRQNLEFIADNQVLEKGADRKQYQYLLLKVTGNTQYSVTAPFKFSSLKKRITMMNKLKSARASLLRFLFLLPLLAVVLLSFRKHFTFSDPGIPQHTVRLGAIVYDEATHQPVPGVLVREEISGLQTYTDDKGYFSFDFPTEDRKVEKHLWMMKSGYQRHLSSFSVVFNKEVNEMGLIGFDALRSGTTATVCSDCASALSIKEEKNPEQIDYASVSRLFLNYLKGNSTGLTTPSGVNWEATMDGNAIRLRTDTVPATTQGGMSEFKRRNPNVNSVSWRKKDEDDALYIRITLKNGKTEEYNLSDEAELKKAESKYGSLPIAPPPPPPPALAELPLAGVPEPPAAPVAELSEIPVVAPPAPPVPATTIKPLPAHVEKVIFNKNNVTVILKNGKQESYDLNMAEDKKAFEAKYGDVIVTSPPTPPVLPRKGVKSSAAPGSATGAGSSSSPGAFNIPGAASPGRTAASTIASSPVAARRATTTRANTGLTIEGSADNRGTASGPGLSTTQAEPAHLNDNNIVLSSPTISYKDDTKKLVILDGKQLPTGTVSLKGDYKVKTLSEKEAMKKYGEKGKYGALEISTVTK